MKRMTPTPVVRGFLAVVVCASWWAADSGVATPVSASQAVAASEAVIYVTAIDGRNTPVADLTAADFAIKEDGDAREVISAQAATGPMQIAFIVDDNGTGLFRYGLLKCAELLQGRAELAIFVVTGQARKIVDFTADARVWTSGIGSLGVRPATPEGGQVLEGVSEAARELRRREARRPVIVVLTVGGEEHSTQQARDVLDQLHASRAILSVVSAVNPALRRPAAASRPADLLDSNFQLDQVLGDGSRQSGGRRRDVLATQALLTDLQEIALDLIGRYEVTYQRPQRNRPPQRLAVSVTRRGVSVIAPTRAPVR